MITSCDVLVVGGGAAGVAAAVSAARQGARTVLVERNRFLGGIGYAGLLQHICGLYANDVHTPNETLNPGIARDVEQALIRKDPGKTIKKIGQVYVLPYRAEDLRAVFSDLCGKEKNLEVYEATAVVRAEIRNKCIESVRLKRLKNEYELLPRMVIDCSGDAAVAAMTGASFQSSSPGERQMAGYVLFITGIVDADDTLSVKVSYHLAQAAQQGKLRESARFTTFSFGDAPGEGYCKMSVDEEDSPGRNERAHEHGIALHRYLASALPAFRSSSLAAASLGVMEREGRRIVGEYILTEHDVLTARKFRDGVVKNSWPIELWERSKGTIYKYLPRGDHYEIPFRCLMVKELLNLLAAGRCISVSREALGSTRVMGACMALGDAAGRAGAHWVRNGSYPEYGK